MLDLKSCSSQIWAGWTTDDIADAYCAVDARCGYDGKTFNTCICIHIG